MSKDTYETEKESGGPCSAPLAPPVAAPVASLRAQLAALEAVHGATVGAAVVIEAQLAEALEDCLEQARLVGMGAERELALMARLAESEARVAAVPTLEWSPTLLDGERVTYAQAEEAAAKLGEGWRLPTIDELLTLADRSRYNPAIDTEAFPDTASDWYWSSTPCAWNSSAVWMVDFYGGIALNDHRDYDACVRAVRSGGTYHCQNNDAEPTEKLAESEAQVVSAEMVAIPADSAISAGVEYMRRDSLFELSVKITLPSMTSGSADAYGYKQRDDLAETLREAIAKQSKEG